MFILPFIWTGFLLSFETPCPLSVVSNDLVNQDTYVVI